MERVPMTKEGYDALQKELKHLKFTVRPQIIEAIRAAREHGDIMENAEFDAAKEKQSHVETKIKQIESVLSRAQIIDTKNLSNDRVVFGINVQVRDTETDEEKTFRLVGEHEANATIGWISINSPVARALLGKEAGEVVRIRIPRGVVEYEILELYSDREEKQDG